MKRHGSLNHIYRLIWSRATNSWVAVAENARGQGKGSRKKLVAAALSLTASFAQAGPTGGQVVSGAASIAQTGATTTINQTTQNVSLNWTSFNIAAQETVNFVQPSASSIAVNHILGNSGSQIFGHLDANGQVYLINPNGILFGAGAQVNVGGLVASTLDFNDAGLTGSQRVFSGTGSGSVINQGAITAANGGYVALLGNHVSNQGTISAQLGTVALGAGSATTLTFSGNNLLHVQVDQSVLNSLAENGGLIVADGGHVIMTAGAKDALLASVVNNTGLIEARTVDSHDGTITLLGGMTAGTVNVGGTLDASAPNGGNGGAIETSAANVLVANDAKITTAAANGVTGSWLIDPTNFTISSGSATQTSSGIGNSTLEASLASSSVSISTSATANGSDLGDVNINAPIVWSSANSLALTALNNVNVNAALTWSGSALTLSAANNVNINAVMTANNSARLALIATSGTVSVGFNSSGGFAGQVNFYSDTGVTPAAGTGLLTIGGLGYTLIDSVGLAGSSTGADLQGISGNLTKNYALSTNIVASGTSTWNSGSGFAPLGTANGSPASAVDFTGTFDGLGHTITGLTVNRSITIGGGLFAAVSGKVRNVGMVGGSVVSSGYAGGLVGELNGGTVSNSYATANVSIGQAQLAGGLVGLMNSGTVSNSYATGNVSATSSTGLSLSVGGLVGGMQGGTVINSYATGTVSGGEGVGGLVGYMYGNTASGEVSTITNSYAKGNVSGTYGVGGLIGSNYGFRANNVISNSYATGNVSGIAQVSTTPTGIGGLVGHNYGNAGYGGTPTVLNSYASGSVTSAVNSSAVGGLVGYNAGTYGAGTVTNSYSAGSVSSGSGSTHVGGLIGLNSFNNTYIPQTFTGTVTHSFWDKTTSGQTTSDAGTGMTTANMQTQANFTSSTAANGSVNPAWDFANTWVMFPGTYPLLKADMTAATVTANAATATYSGSAFSGGNGVTITDTVNGLTSTISPSLTGLTYTGSSQAAVDAGSSYVITPSGLASNQQGYYFIYANGNLTINPLALTGSITAGSSVYGASLAAGTVTFTNAVAGNVPTGTVSISTSGNTSTSGHLKAGSYTGIEAVAGLSGGTDVSDYTFASITGNYSVSKLALTGSIAAGSSVYGASLAAGSVTLTNQVIGDVVTPTTTVNPGSNTSTSGHLNAGSYTGVESISALGGADGANYSFAGVTGNYSVSQLALTATLAAGSSVYGSSLAPGSVSFSNVVSGDQVTPATVAMNTSGNTSSSGHLNAGTYTGIESVSGTLTGSDSGNYTFAGTTGNYSVSQLALTGSIAAGSTVYGASLTAGSATLTNVVGGDVVTPVTVAVNTSGNTSTSGHLNAGSYIGIESISALGGADGGNYSFAGVLGNYSVSQLALSGSIAAGSSVYGASLTPGSVTLTNLVGSDAVTPVTVAVNTSGNTSTSGHLNAGSYTGVESISTLGGTDGANYSYAGIIGNYSVSQLALTATLAAGSSVYGSSLAPGIVSFTNVVGSDQVTAATVAMNTSGNTSSSGHLNAGTYTGIESVSGTLTGGDSGNYTFAGTTGNYSVSQLALTGSIAGGSSVYGASLTPGSVTLTNLVGSDVVTPTTTVNTSGNTSTSGHLNAGSYTGIESISALGGTDGGNYSLAGVSGNYSVSQLALTGSIAAGSSVYGASLTPGSVTLTNLVGGDVVTPVTVAVNTSGNTSSSGHLNAGSYTGVESISALGGADSGNYSFAGINGNYSVSQLALTGSIAAGSSVYGASLTPGSVTLTNLVGGDVVTPVTVTVNTSGNTSTSGHLNAGSYTGVESISALGGADSANYSFAGVSGNYSVSQLALTGSIAAGSSVYGASLTPGSVTWTNLVGSDVVTPTITVNTSGNTSTSGHLNAGSYTGVESISGLGGADNANYSFAGVSGNYSVSQLALTGSIAAGSSVYGSSLTPGSVTLTNLVGSDVVTPTITVNTSGNTSTSGHLNAGSYTGVESISALGGTDGGNYSLAGINGNYSVSQLALIGSIAAGSSVYGASLTPGSVTLTNLVGSDVVTPVTVAVNTSGNTSTSGHLNAGSYTGVESISTLGGTDGANYSYAGIIGNYSVSQLALTATLAAGSSVYGSSLAPGIVSFANVVGSDQVTAATVAMNTSGNTSSSGHLNAGTYTGIESVSGTLAGSDSGNYTFAGTTGNYSVSKLALTGSIEGGSSVYGASLIPGSVTWTNLVGGDVVTPTITVNTSGNTSSSGHLNAGSYTGIESISALGGTDGGNYSLAGVSGNYSVSQLALSGSIAAGSSVYGASLAAGSVTLTNQVIGDVVTPTTTVNPGSNTSTSGHLNAGSYTGVESISALGGADGANYSFAGVTGNYSVSQLALTATLAAGSSVYGSSLAPGSVSFSNVVSGDQVTPATVAMNTSGNTSTSGHLNAGTYTGIESVSGTLAGSDSGNYTFAGTTGNYSVSQLALTGSIAAGSSVYGASLTPGSVTWTNLVGGDVVTPTTTVNTSGNASSSGHLNAGSYTGIESISALGGTDSGNYSFAGVLGNYSVSQLALSGSIATGSSVYGASLVPGAVTLSNLIAGDIVTFPTVIVNTSGVTSGSGNLIAGTHSGVESVGSSVGGADAGNYSYAGLTGNYAVTPLAITVAATGANKVYDGTLIDTATLTSSGLIGGDHVAFADTSATFASKNVGTGVAVSVSGITANGADVGNYTIVSTTASTTANITPLGITVAATGANKTYDGNTSAVVSLSGGLAGDALTFGDTSATFANQNAGTGKAITVAGISIGGTDAANYTLNTSTATTTATVTPAPLTVSGETAANKVYDGTTSATLTGGSLIGVVSGDGSSLSLNDAGSFVSKNVGTGVAVTAADTLSGTAAGNYSLMQPGGLSANITAATLTYNATPASAVAGQTPSGLTGTLSGFVSSDTQLNATSGNPVWSTTAVPDSAPGQYAIDGAGLSAMNYVFVQAAGNATALTLNPGSLPVVVQNIIAEQDAIFNSNPPNFERVLRNNQSGANPPDTNIVINGDYNSVQLKIVNGGVKLPDNLVSIND